MNERLVIAIDGSAGAGKSTVARLLASRLGLVHLDTGATYRLVGFQALRSGVDLDDGESLAKLAEDVARRCDLSPDGQLRFDGEPVADEIRTAGVGEAASRVAVFAEVRRRLVELQRRLVPPRGAVIEGRDIGTVVWPQAQVKAFLEASLAARAARRANDLGVAADGEVVSATATRDERDGTRAASPMQPAPGAIIVDTTTLTPEEVAETILAQLPDVEPRPDWLYRSIRGVLKAVLKGPFHLEVRGAERMPSAGPGILAPNHRSLIDIPVLAALTPRKVWFMGKEELFKSALAARLLERLGAFPVRRGRPDRRALNRALELLANGQLVGVYPEGTRTPTARFDDLQDGVAYLAIRSGAPIVPIALSGTQGVLPHGRKVPKFVTIRVLVGEPFSLGGPATGVVAKGRIHEGTEIARRHFADVMNALEPRP